MTDDRSPRLAWTADGAPRSGRFGDVYFSREDGLAETRAVFLEGCGLPGAWSGRRRFTVGELGFGTGLNIAALLDLWRRTRPDGARLQVFTVEGFPLARDEAARALSAWPDLSEAADALLGAWPDSAPGFHRLDLPTWGATVDVAVGDVAWALGQWTGRADAWFLDGFAPSTNSEMWSDAVLDGVAARSAPDARIATFTVAGAVRRGLSERGFQVDKRPGHGRKRERLEARRLGAPLAESMPRVAIIGAGIAGAALARAFDQLGARPVVVEMEGSGAGASGFPAALVTPRLDAGDAGIAALYAQAVAEAGRAYRAIPNAITAQGVLQLEQSPRDAARFVKIAAQSVWPSGAMSVLDAAACSDHLGEPVASTGLKMAGALAVRPRAILDAWLATADRIEATVARLHRNAEGWTLLDSAGAAILNADAVVIAGGWDAAELTPDLPLAPIRGQADWAEGVAAPAVAWGGYAAPGENLLLFGATHDRGETERITSPEASARNLRTLTDRLPGLAARVEAAGPIQSRVAVRAVTPDRLPLAGALLGQPGLYILSGLGSRGFCAAPLLAQHVAATIMGAPSPLPLDLASRVDPGRFSPS